MKPFLLYDENNKLVKIAGIPTKETDLILKNNNITEEEKFSIIIDKYIKPYYEKN